MRFRWFKAPRAMRLYVVGYAYSFAYIEWRPKFMMWDVMLHENGYPRRVLRTDDLLGAVGLLINLTTKGQRAPPASWPPSTTRAPLEHSDVAQPGHPTRAQP